MATTQAFCLRRSNHLNDMVEDLEKMFKDENMVDVSLSCEDGLIKAHKIILSACSSYFRQIFSKVNNPYQYPIIIIKDMSYADLKAIIDFIYKGEVTVPQEQLNSVLKSAEALKVKGLADVNNQKSQLVSQKNPLDIDNSSNQNRKKKKKRRKTNLNNDDKKEITKNINSSEDVSEYSEEDESLSHHQNSQNQHTLHQISHQHHVLHSQSSQHLNSPVISAITTEGEIEPSRLLEQSMITGDAQNINNIQSISPSSNSNKYPQYLISSVKQMIYDDSSGLIASHLNSNESNTINSNHNLTLAQFEESSSINSLIGQSSLSLLPRQAEEQFNNINNSTTTSSNNSNNLNTQISVIASQTSTSSTQQSSLVNNQNALSTSLLPVQLQQSLGNISAASLPVASAGNIRQSSLALNFDSLSSKRHYQCPVCYKSFSEKGNMKRHTQIHLQHRSRFVCDLCSKCFVWKDNYNRHRRIAHSDIVSSSSGVLNDSGGGGNTAHQEKLQTPATTEAPSLKGNFQCTYCMKKFDVRYSLMRHLRVIHDPARHLFSCSRCGRRFAWKSAYLRHVNVTCVNRTEQGKTS